MFRLDTMNTGSAFRRLLGIALLCAIASPAIADDTKTENNQPQRVKKILEFNDAKTGTLINLLAPDHVKVFVNRSDKGISVSGSAQEIAALEAFAKILTRDEGTNYNTDAAALTELRKTWDSEKTYKLPSSVADALFVVLAFDDVPVYVSRADEGLTIEASKADQKIINRVVQIARGNELGGDKKKQRDKAKQRVAKSGDKKADVKPSKKRNQENDKKRADNSRANKRRKKGGRSDWSPDLKQAEEHRALANRVERLSRRIAALEEQVKDLKENAAHDPSLHAHDDHAHTHADHDHAHPDKVAGTKPKDKPKAEGKSERATDPKMIDRRYRLPKHHADNLFALFAPADITDVIISREGNQLRIRASASDHKLIKRLVNLLKRGDDQEPNKRNKARANAAK